eukprot:CAMPEP_0197027660 /NCGR_PEP_ID=MMETSP1384-20130603/7533_1 /TAXON_ID=29189 /ORGANISM="Ammonia sp." /LENGTH=175 /DNA_ID=CAMNT_0042456537 /DNA_START=126 /DNA_END=653 /DNA_ORIENTATION=+
MTADLLCKTHRGRFLEVFASQHNQQQIEQKQAVSAKQMPYRMQFELAQVFTERILQNPECARTHNHGQANERQPERLRVPSLQLEILHNVLCNDHHLQQHDQRIAGDEDQIPLEQRVRDALQQHAQHAAHHHFFARPIILDLQRTKQRTVTRNHHRQLIEQLRGKPKSAMKASTA